MGEECRDTLLVGSSPTPTAKIYTTRSKFECSLCGKHVELTKHVIKVVDGKVVCPDAKCCDEYMESVKENKGFGGIIKKPNGTVSGKF